MGWVGSAALDTDAEFVSVAVQSGGMGTEETESLDYRKVIIGRDSSHSHNIIPTEQNLPLTSAHL